MAGGCKGLLALPRLARARRLPAEIIDYFSAKHRVPVLGTVRKCGKPNRRQQAVDKRSVCPDPTPGRVSCGQGFSDFLFIILISIHSSSML